MNATVAATPAASQSLLQKVHARVLAWRTGARLVGREGAATYVGPGSQAPLVPAAISSPVAGAALPGASSPAESELVRDLRAHLATFTAEDPAQMAANLSQLERRTVASALPPASTAEPAARSGILQPLRPPTHQPSPVAAPAAVSVPTSEAERARVESFANSTAATAIDRWRAVEHLATLDSGESPPPFLSQRERDEQCIVLHQQLNNKATPDKEKWRIGEHIAALEGGGNPGAFIPGSVINGRLLELESALEKETDPKEICRLASQIDAVAKGEPFVSREEARAQYEVLEAKLEASTCPRERYRIAEAMNAFEWIR